MTKSKTASKRKTAALANTKAESKKANGIHVQQFKEDQRITVLAKENPKRAKSKEHARFAKYKSGMTVAAAKEARIADNLNLSRDVAFGYIKVS